MNFLRTLDFWLMVLSIGFLIMLEWERLRRWLSQPSVKRFGKGMHPVMSRSMPVPGHSGAGTGSARVVPRQQHQAAPELVLDFEDVLDYLRRHNLTDEQAIDLLTLAKRESGDLLSANKIRDIVGGNEAAIKARVASHRPKPPAPKPVARLERPPNGWKAS